MDTNTGAHQDLLYPAARFNEKGCLQACGGDALVSPQRPHLKRGKTTRQNCPTYSKGKIGFEF